MLRLIALLLALAVVGGVGYLELDAREDKERAATNRKVKAKERATKAAKKASAVTTNKTWEDRLPPYREGIPTDAAKRAAADLYDDVKNAYQVPFPKMDIIKAKIEELGAKYSDTNSYKAARKRAQHEYSVIYKDAPTSLNVEKWYTNQPKHDLPYNQPTMLVFWEVWNPHGRRELPKTVQAISKKFGIQVVGLTKVTRTATDEKVRDFIKEKKLTFPIAKENGDLSKYFGVNGIPAVAVVKFGRIIWRGHPAQVTDSMIYGWRNGDPFAPSQPLFRKDRKQPAPAE